MSSVHIRDVAPETLRALKRLARSNRRSLQGELHVILARAAEMAPPDTPPSPTQNGRLGWFIGRNTDRPSWAGTLEERRNVRRGFDAIRGRVTRTHAEYEVPARATRASRGEDPWFWISGRAVLALQYAAYLLGAALTAILMAIKAADFASILFISLVAGTFSRYAVSIVILAVTGYVGLVSSLIRAGREFWKVWVTLGTPGTRRNPRQAVHDIAAGCRAAIATVQEERARNEREWRLATA